MNWIGDQRPGFTIVGQTSYAYLMTWVRSDWNESFRLGILQRKYYSWLSTADFVQETIGVYGAGRYFLNPAQNYLMKTQVWQINAIGNGSWYFRISEASTNNTLAEIAQVPGAGQSFGDAVWTGQVEVNDDNSCAYSYYWDYFGPVQWMYGSPGNWTYANLQDSYWGTTSYSTCGYMAHGNGTIDNGNTGMLAIY